MLTQLKMPDMATTGGTMKIAEWKKEIGQELKRGDILMDVETDKALSEVECAVAGVLRERMVQPGDDVLAGDIIAIIEVTA